MEFTKEEISLCKQVAEKHRKEIKEGSYLSFIDKVWLIYHITGPWISIISNGAKHTISTNLDNQDEWFPLWTISDCLEFLNQANSFKTQLYNTKWNWYCKTKRYEIGAKEYFARGKTPLEACLKVVLAVVEEMSSGQMDK